MRVLWGVICVCACNAPEPTAKLPPAVAATVTLRGPACPVIAAGAELALNARSEGEDVVAVVEIDRPDRTTLRALRTSLPVGEDTALVIPSSAFGVGEHHVRLLFTAVDGVGLSDDYALAVVIPDGTASDEDVDGDCYSPRLGDCADNDASRHPSAVESCGNGTDDDCNGLLDLSEPACIESCPDADGDGSKAAVCGGPDCNDRDPFTRPNGVELCNGKDDDCDGVIDEVFDVDGDTFVHCNTDTSYVPNTRTDGGACPTGYTTCGDCDDRDATVFPGPSEPQSGACGNGILDPGEECEDSNSSSGDGCDASCVVECEAGDGTNRVGVKLQSTHHCYTLLRQPLFLYDAEAACRSTFGPRVTMAILSTAEEIALVTTGALAAPIQSLSTSSIDGAWLGADDLAIEGDYRWHDGAPYNAFGWLPGQPDNGGPGGNNDCFLLLSGGNFPLSTDRSCIGNIAAPLCELPAAKPLCPPELAR